MHVARITIAIIGILLPYIARIPRGMDWLRQYTHAGVSEILFFSIFNAIAWGSMIGLSFIFRHRVALLLPCTCGFVFLAWAHYQLDLASDPQAAIALIFIPVYALLPIAIGGVAGYVLDRKIKLADYN